MSAAYLASCNVFCDHLQSYANHFKTEMLANVLIRIDYENLTYLLLNMFLENWLKRFMDYPLCAENIVSVRLMKGNNGIHLDNKENAILEHCLNPDRTKLLKPPLNILVLLDAEHLKKAKAHWDNITAELKDQDIVCFSPAVSISNLIFSAVLSRVLS